MAISTNQKPTIYRNLYENTAPAMDLLPGIVCTIVGAPGEAVMSALVEKLERNDETEQSGDFISFQPTTGEFAHLCVYNRVFHLTQ